MENFNMKNEIICHLRRCFSCSKTCSIYMASLDVWATRSHRIRIRFDFQIIFRWFQRRIRKRIWRRASADMCHCIYFNFIYTSKSIRNKQKNCRVLTFTAVIFISCIMFTIRIDPFNDFHMIGYERWNITFQNGSISFNYIFIIHLGFVKLADHWMPFQRFKIWKRLWEQKYFKLLKFISLIIQGVIENHVNKLLIHRPRERENVCVSILSGTNEWSSVEFGLLVLIGVSWKSAIQIVIDFWFSTETNDEQTVSSTKIVAIRQNFRAIISNPCFNINEIGNKWWQIAF